MGRRKILFFGTVDGKYMYLLAVCWLISWLYTVFRSTTTLGMSTRAKDSRFQSFTETTRNRRCLFHQVAKRARKSSNPHQHSNSIPCHGYDLLSSSAYDRTVHAPIELFALLQELYTQIGILLYLLSSLVQSLKIFSWSWRRIVAPVLLCSSAVLGTVFCLFLPLFDPTSVYFSDLLGMNRKRLCNLGYLSSSCPYGKKFWYSSVDRPWIRVSFLKSLREAR